MNNITLTGRTTKDCELRFTPSGKAVANGTIAVQRKFKNANGEYDVDFIDFVAWGKTGELIAEHVKKGERFGITGQLQTRTYENNEGRKIKVVEVNVTDFDFPVRPKSTNQGQSQPTRQGQSQPSNDPFYGGDEIDQELPF